MAFAQVVTTATSSHDTAVTNHTVDLPSGIQANDLLLVFFGNNGGTDSGTYPGGWTKPASGTGANNIAASWAWRVATGSEGASITVTTSSSWRSAHVAYRIVQHDSSTNAPSFIGYWNSGTNAAPDSYSHNPTGTKDFLWINAVAADSGYLVTGLPTGYTNAVNADSGSTANLSVGMSTHRRELNADSHNPDAATLEGAEGWLSTVVAVHPGSEGTPPAGAAVLDPFGMSGFFGA